MYECTFVDFFVAFVNWYVQCAHLTREACVHRICSRITVGIILASLSKIKIDIFLPIHKDIGMEMGAIDTQCRPS